MAKATLKTTQTAASVAAFLAAVADEHRRADAKAVAKLMRDVTGEPAKMWGAAIVGFGRCHYKYESGREGDMPKIGFSPRKQSLVLYLTAGFGEYASLMKTLGKHKTGKSCLYINKLDDVDVAVLRRLIEKSYAATTAKYG